MYELGNKLLLYRFITLLLGLYNRYRVETVHISESQETSLSKRSNKDVNSRSVFKE